MAHAHITYLGTGSTMPCHFEPEAKNLPGLGPSGCNYGNSALKSLLITGVRPVRTVSLEV